jgi:hypothetical protein
MTATINAVHADPGAGSLGPSSMTERTQQDFVTSLQSDAISGMPQLANPGALASELFNSLRGYFERAQNLQRAIRNVQSTGADGGGANVVLASISDAPRVDLHGGPARESLEPAGAGGDVSSVVRTSVAEVERFTNILLEAMEFGNETTLIGHEVFSVARSVNTLLRGQ